jgi:hypothetical protein
MRDQLDDIRQRLVAISEELADLVLDRLRESVEAGRGEPGQEERMLTRARRAVDKAVEVLGRRDDEP